MQIPPSPIRPLLKKLIVRGLAAVDAHAAVGRAISRNGAELTIGRRRYDLSRYERVVVVGAGKATAPMARAVEQRLGRLVHSGFVVVKDGHGLYRPDGSSWRKPATQSRSLRSAGGCQTLCHGGRTRSARPLDRAPVGRCLQFTPGPCRRDYVSRQAADHRETPAMRRDHPRNQYRSKTSLAHQRRTSRRVDRSHHCDAHSLRCVG